MILTRLKCDFVTWDILTENWFSLPQEDEKTVAEDGPGTLTSEEPDESEPSQTDLPTVIEEESLN